MEVKIIIMDMIKYKLWKSIQTKLHNATSKVTNILNHTGICRLPIQCSEGNRINVWYSCLTLILMCLPLLLLEKIKIRDTSDRDLPGLYFSYSFEQNKKI